MQKDGSIGGGQFGPAFSPGREVHANPTSTTELLAFPAGEAGLRLVDLDYPVDGF